MVGKKNVTYEGHSLYKKEVSRGTDNRGYLTRVVNVLSLLFMAPKGAVRKEAAFWGGLGEGYSTVNAEKGEVYLLPCLSLPPPGVRRGHTWAPFLQAEHVLLC